MGICLKIDRLDVVLDDWRTETIQGDPREREAALKAWGACGALTAARQLVSLASQELRQLEKGETNAKGEPPTTT
jgi:hypothetical protein